MFFRFKHNYLPIIALCFFIFPCHALKLDRVILSSDSHLAYLQFWPVVAPIWTNVVGVRPTLILVANEKVKVDESLGDVIRFKPIPGLKTAMQAAIIRLFAPVLFPDECSLISDIDMLPLQRSYFHDSIAHIPDDHFVVYRDGEYPERIDRFAMCYVAGKGSVYGQLFRVHNMPEIRKLMCRLKKREHRWGVDERVLYACVTQWCDYHTRCTLLGHGKIGRVIRKKPLELKRIVSGELIDWHMPRPYTKYKCGIEKVIRFLMQKTD